MIAAVALMSMFIVGSGASVTLAEVQEHRSTDQIDLRAEINPFMERGDIVSAYNYLMHHADAGNAEAQFGAAILLLGTAVGFDLGFGSIEQIDSVAVDLIRSSARSGHEDALVRIADSYRHGWAGFPQNAMLARCWEAVRTNADKLDECIDLERELFDLGSP